MDAALEQAVETVLGARDDVAAVYVFGSVARGTAGPTSDVDLAVLFNASPPHTLDGPRFTVEGDLERAVNTPIDLVVLNDAPVDLRIRVLRDGLLLVDRNRLARIAFEVRTRNEFFDLEPVLSEYRAPRHTQP